MYSWLTEDASKEGIEQFDRDLLKAPPGVRDDAKRSEPGWSPEEQYNSFAAQMARQAARGG